MRKVPTDKFYSLLKEIERKGGGAIMPKIVNSEYPYVSVWKNERTGNVFGKSEGRYINGVNGLTETVHYISEA